MTQEQQGKIKVGYKDTPTWLCVRTRMYAFIYK